MNQILSVEMQNNKSSKNRRKMSAGNGKASTKSVITFFCIILIIFGITISSLGVFSTISNSAKKQPVDVKPNVEQANNKPKIEAIQNASEVEIEVFAKNIISSIEYKWNNGEIQQEEVNGTNSVSFNISNIPSGNNTLTVVATDVNGATETFTHEYVGEEEANVTLSFNEETGKLQVICEEEKEIATISYNYDDEDPQPQEINSTSGRVEISEIRQGEHELTITVTYSDGSSKKKMKKIYFPVVQRVKAPPDGSVAMLSASDVRTIIEVQINLNGNDLVIEKPNSETYERTLTTEDGIIEGENRLILTVTNSDGVSTTTRTKWIKTN